jgi:hypothetical protein
MGKLVTVSKLSVSRCFQDSSTANFCGDHVDEPCMDVGQV